MGIFSVLGLFLGWDILMLIIGEAMVGCYCGVDGQRY